MAASFGTSAGRQQGAFPLPSPSPRLPQTGRSSPAINAATFAGVASRQVSGPGSPSPGLGGLSGEVGRTGGGSRFVNTAVSIPAALPASRTTPLLPLVEPPRSRASTWVPSQELPRAARVPAVSDHTLQTALMLPTLAVAVDPRLASSMPLTPQQVPTRPARSSLPTSIRWAWLER